MANKNLTDLTARTATADSDLIHVNSGGTDYKETKANFLSNITSSISSINSSLARFSVKSISVAAGGSASIADLFSTGGVYFVMIGSSGLVLNNACACYFVNKYNGTLYLSRIEPVTSSTLSPILDSSGTITNTNTQYAANYKVLCMALG